MKWLKTYRYELLVVLVTAVGAILRFWEFGDWSLTNDELSALYRARFDSWREVPDKGVAIDGHPAFAQWLLWAWTNAFGTLPGAIRFPFVLTAVSAIPVCYLAGRRMFSKSAALLAATALAFLQFPLLFARVARPYAPGLLFVLLVAWALAEFRHRKEHQPAHASSIFAMPELS